MTLTTIKKAGLDELALDHVFTVGASGTDHYTFQGEGLNGTVNDPTLYLTRGKTYRFEKGSAHPLRIQSTAGASGTAYNTGVTNNGGTGTVIVEVQHDAPDILYYQCTSHPNMNGILYITGALADGGVTTAKLAANAVTTAKIADDAITTDKIGTNAVSSGQINDNAVGSNQITSDAVVTSKIASGAVTTARLADDAVTTAKIADDAVDTAQILNNAVTNSKLTSNAVTTVKIADSAVTDAKISGMAASKLTGALPAISGANLTGISSAGVNRNLVINGAMLVAQRGTSSAGEGYKTVDRFQFYKSGTNETPNQAQVDVSSGGAYDAGFRKAYQIQNGNQSSAGANDLVFIETKLESQDIASSGWNYTSSSSYVTLSFWVKSSVGQNFYGYLLTKDGTDRTYPFETGTLSANTWTKVTKAIPGSNLLRFDNDANAGLHIIWWPFIGDGYTDNSVSLNTWGSYSGSARTPDYTTTWYMTNDSTFQLTGVQLEVGNTATDFEHKSFGDELHACQRYYDKSYDYGTAPGTATQNGAVVHSLAVSGHNYAGFPLEFSRTMRAQPTVTLYSTNNGNTGKSSADSSDGNAQVSYTGHNRTFQYRGNDSSGTGKNVFLRVQYQAEAEL